MYCPFITVIELSKQNWYFPVKSSFKSTGNLSFFNLLSKIYVKKQGIEAKCKKMHPKLNLEKGSKIKKWKQQKLM